MQIEAEIVSSADCLFAVSVYSLVTQNQRTVQVKVVGERRTHTRRRIAYKNERRSKWQRHIDLRSYSLGYDCSEFAVQSDTETLVDTVLIKIVFLQKVFIL